MNVTGILKQGVVLGAAIIGAQVGSGLANTDNRYLDAGAMGIGGATFGALATWLLRGL